MTYMDQLHSALRALIAAGEAGRRSADEMLEPMTGAISDIAEATDTPKSTIRAVLEQLSEIVSDALENGDEITLPGIGKLKVSERPARTGRNPQTGKAIEIAAKKVVKYVPAKALSDAIN